MNAMWRVIVGALLLVIYSVARAMLISLREAMVGGHSGSSGDFIAIVIVGLQDPLSWIVLFIGLIFIDTAVRLKKRRRDRRK